MAACSILEGTRCLVWGYICLMEGSKKILPRLLPSPHSIEPFSSHLFSFLPFCTSPWGPLPYPTFRPYLISPHLCPSFPEGLPYNFLWKTDPLQFAWLKLHRWLLCDSLLTWKLGMKSPSGQPACRGPQRPWHQLEQSWNHHCCLGAYQFYCCRTCHSTAQWLKTSMYYFSWVRDSRLGSAGWFCCSLFGSVITVSWGSTDLGWTCWKWPCFSVSLSSPGLVGRPKHVLLKAIAWVQENKQKHLQSLSKPWLRIDILPVVCGSQKPTLRCARTQQSWYTHGYNLL